MRYTTIRPDSHVGATVEAKDMPHRRKTRERYIDLAWGHGRWRLVSPIDGLAARTRLAVAATPGR